MDDWVLIKELAQTDLVERFIALMQQWFASSQR